MKARSGVLREEQVQLPAGGPRLALRRGDGAARPFLLVHGLASNARLWDGVARRLTSAGHEVVAVDLRGHGRSADTDEGNTTEQAAADLALLCVELGLAGEREPVVAGQSWGGNVVVTLAARHGGVAGLALVDGGWIVLGEGFPTYEQCWAALAPPVFQHVRYDGLSEQVRQWHPDWPAEGIAGTVANFVRRPDGSAAPRLSRDHHCDILRSLWESDPRPLYERVRVPVLVVPAVPPDGGPLARPGPAVALDLLPDVEVAWYEGADHDLHAQHPERLTADLLSLAARVERARA